MDSLDILKEVETKPQSLNTDRDSEYNKKRRGVLLTLYLLSYYMSLGGFCIDEKIVKILLKLKKCPYKIIPLFEVYELEDLMCYYFYQQYQTFVYFI